MGIPSKTISVPDISGIINISLQAARWKWAVGGALISALLMAGLWLHLKPKAPADTKVQEQTVVTETKKIVSGMRARTEVINHAAKVRKNVDRAIKTVDHSVFNVPVPMLTGSPTIKVAVVPLDSVLPLKIHVRALEFSFDSLKVTDDSIITAYAVKDTAQAEIIVARNDRIREIEHQSIVTAIKSAAIGVGVGFVARIFFHR